jgi:hypothetical protein
MPAAPVGSAPAIDNAHGKRLVRTENAFGLLCFGDTFDRLFAN